MGALVFVVFGTIAAAAVSPSPFILILSGLTLVLCILLLWTAEDLPLLIFPVIYQWSEISAKPLATAFYDVPVNALADLGANLERGVMFGLLGLICLAVGLKVGAGRPGPGLVNHIQQDTYRLSMRQVLVMSLVAIISGHLLYNFSGSVGPARQIFLALAQVKLAGLFVFAYWCFTRRRGYLILAPLVGMEIVIGMLGFFADFRSPVLIVFLAAVAARPKLRIGDILIGGIVAAVIIVTASFWTWVKPDYRDFVNLGTGQQIVARPIEERLEFLGERALAFDFQDMAQGFEGLIFRHSYVDFLSHTLAYVPENVPHEGGARLGQSIIHILTPRILFPNKAVLVNDSEVSAYYTGLPLNLDPNTSISLGYMAELYIDFGYAGALVGMAIFGFIAGYIYRYLRRQVGQYPLLTYGLIAMWVLTLASFGLALIKFVGFVIITLLAVIAIRNILWPRVAPIIFPPRRIQTPAD